MDLIKVGPFGGHRGTIWDEKGRDQIAGIYVYYSKEGSVYALEFLYYENGKLVESNKFGHHIDGSKRVVLMDCSFSAVVFDYSSEFITSISGCFDKSCRYLKTIRFGTNKGSYGSFGSTSTDDEDLDFNFQLGNHTLFGGFHGRQNSHDITGIGIYVKPIISSLINLRNPRVKDEKD